MELLSTSSASSLTAAVGSNTATTFDSLIPVIAIVVGVVLAIGLAAWIVSLFRGAFSRRTK